MDPFFIFPLIIYLIKYDMQFSTLNFKREIYSDYLQENIYSKLNDELNGLKVKLLRLQDDLDYRLHSITSMQDDEYRAKEQLNTIQDLLKKAKLKLKDYKLPVIPIFE